MYMCGELCLHPSLYLDQHNGGGVETTGAIEWVHAMLLQSRDGVLRVGEQPPVVAADAAPARKHGEERR